MSLKKLGRYDLIRVLGRGAMGLVYEGRDPNLDRRVAIKTIKVESLSEEAATEYEVRFRTEAHSAARLQHPNIVSVYDSDRDGDIAYLVMEFVRGDDLKHHLDKGEVYTLEQTVSIMTDLLSALSYAHQQGVVHRDIKPANLLVIAGGRIKLADFGVARIQDSGDATRTQGTIVGTLKYMSPEQLEGKPIDARTDLFAAGVVLYQLVTGKRPFDGDTDFAVIQKIVSHQPAAPTSFNAKLPPALDAVVAKALAKSRDARYPTAQEFAAALQAACQEASDITIAPAVNLLVKGKNATWTATMMPGESLVTTESGVSISTGTSASLVTQEVELVYWKDIKESNDVADLQGFLEKFPNGIYGDLARRRLRNLGIATTADTSEATQLTPRVTMTEAEAVAVAAAAANDKTVLMVKSGPAAAHAAQNEPSLASAANTSSAANTASTASAANTSNTASQLLPTAVAPAVVNTDVGVTQPNAMRQAPATRQNILPTRTAPPVPLPTPTPTPTPTSTPTPTAISTSTSTRRPTPTGTQSSKPTSKPTSKPPSKPSPKPTVAARPLQRAPLWIAAAAMLAVAGITFKLWPTSSRASSAAVQATSPALAASAASTASTASTSQAPSLGAAVPETVAPPAAVAATSGSAVATNSGATSAAPAVAPTVVPTATASVVGLPVTKAVRPVVAASKAPNSLTIKKPAVEAERAGSQSVAAASAPAAQVAPVAPPSAVANSSVTSPKAICDDRVLFAFQNCLNEQCAKPVFAQHPTCVERRVLDERRREIQRNR